MYLKRADILRDIKKHACSMGSKIDIGQEGKVVIHVNDEDPRNMEIINQGRGFCIIVHFERVLPENQDTNKYGISTGSKFQGMMLTPRSKAYYGFLELYNTIKGGIL